MQVVVDNFDLIKEKEVELLKKVDELVAQKNSKELSTLISSLKQSLWIEDIPKAKMTKILKQLLDALASIPNTQSLQKSIVMDLIEWSRQENRIYLKLYLETRLALIYFEMALYHEALSYIGSLLKELRKLDDKMMLLEVQLLESRVNYALKNIPKAKASLTSAKTSANAIYCPPNVQAGLDMQSGILHAEEKDYKTAYSYFYETFENLSSVENSKTSIALKYMLLCKIMMSQSDEVLTLIHSKTISSYKQNREIEAIIAIAKAHQSRSLKEFEQVLRSFENELSQDLMVRSHLNSLYDSLLEKNLLKLIEPYSRVEISYLADIIKLPYDIVERKLSQMILDKCFAGMLDQSSGHLIVLDDPAVDENYQSMIGTIKHMETVVSSLYQKASALA